MKWVSIVQFVPNAARDERINVATIAGDDETESASIRIVSHWGRAKKVDDSGGGLPLVFDFVTRLQERLEEDPASLTRDDVSKLAERMNNVVQLSCPRPISATSLESALHIGFTTFVVEPTSQTQPYATKSKAKGSVNRAYKQLQIPFTKDTQAVCGPYRTDFDFAAGNGTLVQLVSCWSFEISDQRAVANEIQSWVWGIRKMRASKDSVHAGHSVVSPTVDISLVFVPPKDDWSAYKVAEAAANDSDIKVRLVRDTEASVVATRARELLSSPAVHL